MSAQRTTRNVMGLLLVCATWLVASGTLLAQDAVDAHQVWDRLLGKHVTDNGRVNYKGFAEDEEALDGYLARLAVVDADSLSRPQRLAFWINAYNACTVKLILKHYPVVSIRDISKPWDSSDWTLAGRKMSLNQVEHEELRRKLKEPRIHFAIVCASVGCPDLWNRAFTAAGVDEQLDGRAKAFTRSKKHVQMTKLSKFFGGSERVLYLNPIFKWFSEDFTDRGKRPIRDYIAGYANDEIAGYIHESGAALKVRYLDYDWNLNDAR